MTVLEEYDSGLQEEAWVLCENKGVGWDCVNSARGRLATINLIPTFYGLYLIYTADLPTTDNTTISTFTLLATDSDPALASQKLQQHLDLLQEWFHKWKIKINQTKSSQITFTTKHTNCPPATINNIQIPV
jgi:hypothetical protein